MGQHNHNPTAIAAKQGLLPPKPPKMRRMDWRKELGDIFMEGFVQKYPEMAAFMAVMNGEGKYGKL